MLHNVAPIVACGGAGVAPIREVGIT
jgi:hypothetical protein